MIDDDAPVTHAQLRQALTELKTELKTELNTELKTELRTELREDIAQELGQHTKALMKHMTGLFRAADDRARAVADRVTVVEARLDEHLADAAMHRAPPKRTRRR